jgi:5-formyltetrahydrofolate cyclo-ligase
MAEASADVREARRRLRRLRTALPRGTRLAAERAILAALERLPLLKRGARVALYLPMRGEVDVRPSIAAAWRRGVRVYVPRIVHRRRGRMVFVAWTPDGPRMRNAFGIEEPAAMKDRRSAAGLDTVVLPVVGFDARGHRLGMGAGFYDRALRRRLDATRPWRRPRLVGVAFACQELEAIPVSPWDVRLDLIVTERGVRRPRRVPPGSPTP